MSTTTREELYLSPEFPTRLDLEEAIEMWDSTTAGWVARCPRYGEYAIRYGLVAAEEAPYLNAGKALHSAMATFYTSDDPDLALGALRKAWGKDEAWRLPPGHSFAHLHLGHLEVIFRNYVDFARKRDTFRPIVVSLDDLNLKNVLGAVWNITPDGKVVLGESKIIMRFMLTLPTGETVPFVYAGRPDLPIDMGGSVYVLDHKSTNAFLSAWYFNQYKHSNQLRGYGAMLQDLLPSLSINGALINGIYMGEKASLGSTDTKVTRFARYGPMLFQPAHLNEALLNQYYWRQSLDYHESKGYYPQHSSKLCQSCTFDPLCSASPIIRPSVMKQEYVRRDPVFLDL